ncbi:tegument serine/threonine protein kinase [Saimiriine betaherpesvirus 4]|uniref:Tegument serine/threonine protein kinase n=1 Tax=Saimiriine betaherpesvirus 4 TaxID=1535247 RepID=G8XT01_9BETA|nr:tegument serine/threonine protein kinase [Saimiriine betaherpesvirus 4]AEV80947.1 tegument serine/threonine protein kinase [Saimiriine betaherpesvirus 4]
MSSEEIPTSPDSAESSPTSCPPAPKKTRRRRRICRRGCSSVKRTLKYPKLSESMTGSDVNEMTSHSTASSGSGSPTERFLRCEERIEKSGRSSSENMSCPICRRSEELPLTSSVVYSGSEDEAVEREECGHTYSNEHRIVTSVRGLTCDPNVFCQLTAPQLYETTGASTHVVVYAPKSLDFCESVCQAVNLDDENRRLGQGSFGEIWPLDQDRVVKIAKRHSETILTVWISGMIRSRAGGVSDQGDGVFRGLLTSVGCCLLHNVTVSARFQTDMYHHDAWGLESLNSYGMAFKVLADAVRFLNHDCHVCHFDITPMNVLIDVNPQKPSEIVRVALCDYSLCEPYPALNRRCAVIFQETQSARILPSCRHRLRECYHPAFRPIPLQKLVTLNAHARFPIGSSQRFCAAEMTALTNVLMFCLARILDRRGFETVRAESEFLLFKHASAACRALDLGDVVECSKACLLILAAQASYLNYILGDVAVPAVCRLHRFVESRFDRRQVAVFKRYYGECGKVMDHGNVRKNLDQMLNTRCGLYLYDAVRRAGRFTSVEDLECDCRIIFPE